MKKIVDSILKEEAQAKRLLDEARSSAERLVQDARRDAAEYNAKIIADTKQALTARYVALKEQYTREKEKIISDLVTRTDTESAGHAGRIDVIAQQLFDSIIAIE
ncbi:MAG: hypothetical protein ABH865_03970 [Candidatus Omnitrophota bacterium]|nr:hypothetical protein [Candidatus Omnitrophota bacterium]